MPAGEIFAPLSSSSLSLPLKDSQLPFSQGDPGSI